MLPGSRRTVKKAGPKKKLVKVNNYIMARTLHYAKKGKKTNPTLLHMPVNRSKKDTADNRRKTLKRIRAEIQDVKKACANMDPKVKITCSALTPQDLKRTRTPEHVKTPEYAKYVKWFGKQWSAKFPDRKDEIFGAAAAAWQMQWKNVAPEKKEWLDADSI